jgi:hypothetical protein
MNVHFFKEWYIRLSSEKFTINETQNENLYVHLTNNAIQKYGSNYGKHENGNILPWHVLKEKFASSSKTSMDKVLTKMKDMIMMSLLSVKSKLNSNDRKYCFELFGYDFMLDTDFNVWLIEVNTNPCIEEPNQYLSTVIPRMLDDAFKLTIDRIFIPIGKNFRAEDALKSYEEFPVEGYTNKENIWEYLVNISPKNPSKRR